MIDFKKVNKADLSTLPNTGESIIFCEDEQSLYIDGKNGYRKPIVTPTDQFELTADLETGHLYYKYGGGN